MPVTLNSPLTLSCGLTLPNRLVKAAMTEGLADPQNRATGRHEVLYRRWSEGGAGALITGNVQIDRRNLERPGNIVIEGAQPEKALERLESLAIAAKSGGSRVFMQLSHAGRQTLKQVNTRPVAPSPVALKVPGGQFGVPRAMTDSEVQETIGRFAHAARIARDCGFDGVQVHAAHGYLISQFLSPRSNLREDQWGGTLANRARLLVDILRAVRLETGSGFAIGVKLNSSDFQKGGFSHEDCLAVIDMLNAESVDFVEVSGGNYEQPRMAGFEGPEPVFADEVRASTRAREAYFAAYARSVKLRAKMPVLATGGFRQCEMMNAALEDNDADLIGLARPLCVDPATPAKLLSGEIQQADAWETRLRLGPGRWLGPSSPSAMLKLINGVGTQGWFCMQLLRMGEGLEPDARLGVFKALRLYQANEKRAAKAYHAALEAEVT